MSEYELPLDEWWSSRILFRNEVGSTSHGIGIAGKEDYDEMGCYWQPAATIVGISPGGQDNVIYRPGRKPDEKSGPGDWDLTLYSARKWCSLAVKGNPSILVSLFGPRKQTTPQGIQLLDNPQWFWSEQARDKFLGYAKSQRERMMRKRGGRDVNRPELENLMGFDVKYASHMLRLGFQGIEFMETGRLELPMRPSQRNFLLEVRHGEISLGGVLKIAEDLEEQLKNVESAAPQHPNYDAINGWLVSLLNMEE